jgi:hypothetical protein
MELMSLSKILSLRVPNQREQTPVTPTASKAILFAIVLLTHTNLDLSAFLAHELCNYKLMLQKCDPYRANSCTILSRVFGISGNPNTILFK